MAVFNLWLTDVIIFLLLGLAVVGLLIIIVSFIVGAKRGIERYLEETDSEDK